MRRGIKMAIPESQLEVWSHQGSIQQSAATYGTIKSALEAQSAGYSGKAYEVFLQGSYGNDTNIYAESDVDVVIRLDSNFYHDLSLLTPQQQALFQSPAGAAFYAPANYQMHVTQALRAAFGYSVSPDNKAIKVSASGARRSVDVIPAFQFRRY